jgi:hypothetical protein
MDIRVRDEYSPNGYVENRFMITDFVAIGQQHPDKSYINIGNITDMRAISAFLVCEQIVQKSFSLSLFLNSVINSQPEIKFPLSYSTVSAIFSGCLSKIIVRFGPANNFSGAGWLQAGAMQRIQCGPLRFAIRPYRYLVSSGRHA